jgi:hypothetical protein
MLRIIQNTSGSRAKSYFDTAHYYLEGQQELAGVWRGEGAKRLGLSGQVQRAEPESATGGRYSPEIHYVVPAPSE